MSFDLIQLVHAAVANLVVGYIAYKKRALNRLGVYAAYVAGSLIYLALGWQGFFLMLVFLALGSIASKHKYEEKQRLGVAQKHMGVRGVRQVLANSLAPLGFSVLAVLSNGSAVFVVAFAAAVAAATADTLSTELGQVYGRRPRLIKNMKPVAVGTHGAVSGEGSLFGLFGACIIAGAAYLTGFAVSGASSIIVVSGFLGSVVDSILGATLEERGIMGNEEINFLCTLSGGLFAMALMLL